MQTFTRSQYLAWECNHDQYYGQYCTKDRINKVRLSIGLDTILLSKDPHFNDIRLSNWDFIQFDKSTLSKEMEQQGDSLTRSGIVCIGKECARIIKAYHYLFDSLPIEEKIKLVAPY